MPGLSLKFLSVRLPLMLLLMGFVLSAQAIIIRHDRSNSRYLIEEVHYPQVFFLDYSGDNKVCVATLIKPEWAITAGHCVDQTPIRKAMDEKKPYQLVVAGESYEISKLVVHPAYQNQNQSEAIDLALIRLDRAVPDVKPAEVYQNHDEAGKVVSFLGWGYTGIGTVGSQHNDGKFRRAQNTVMHADQWLQFSFSDPRKHGSKALAQEGVPGLGDSGGPALIETSEGLVVLGVAIGEVEGEDNPEGAQGRYGAIELYERLSSHLIWINDVLKD